MLGLCNCKNGSIPFVKLSLYEKDHRVGGARTDTDAGV